MAVGRSRDAPIDAMFADYVRRCPWPIRLLEVQPRGSVAPERRKEAEADLLRAAVPAGAAVVALDEHGPDRSSKAFAHQLGSWRDDGRRLVAFLIGGPDGLAASILAGADAHLAFGRLTWPHLLVRVMLAEQLLSGHHDTCRDTRITVPEP